MKKRILALLLAICMCSSLFVVALAENIETDPDAEEAVVTLDAEAEEETAVPETEEAEEPAEAEAEEPEADSPEAADEDAAAPEDEEAPAEEPAAEEPEEEAAGIATYSADEDIMLLGDDGDGTADADQEPSEFIYLNGESGNDSNDGLTAEKAVKTFSAAKGAAEAAGITDICVTGAVTVTDTETWDGGLTLCRDENFTTGSLVAVNAGGNLTLQDLTLDGKNISVSVPVISVTGSGSQLTVESGTVIENGNNSSNQVSDHTGGGVGVYRGGCLVMNSGEITRNKCPWGGGVCLYGGADAETPVATSMILNDGTISQNEGTTSGGGIELYNGSTLTMNGGVITENTAGGTGGGLNVSRGCKAYVYAGDFTKNAAKGTGYGGGAIYVDEEYSPANGTHIDAGELYLYNVEITGNQTTATDGGYNATIGACQVSNVELSVTDGAVIHDNDDEKTFMVYQYPTSAVFNLTPIMLGGAVYNWTDLDGNLLDLDDLTFENSDSNRWVYAVTKVSTSDGTVSGVDRCKVHITNNTSYYLGSAIGTNGNVYIGKDDGDVSITITKTWDQDMETATLDSVVVNVYAVDGNGDRVYIGQQTLTAEENWTVSIKNLPKYDYDGNEFTYIIEEGEHEGYFSEVTGGEVNCSGTHSGYDNDTDKTATYEFVITNTKIEDLTVGKTVEGTSDTDEYTFEITLANVAKNESTTAYEGDINAVYAITSGEASADRTGVVTFEDGTATVTIQAGETVKLEIGYGMEWSVREQTTPTDGSVTVSCTEGENGEVKMSEAEYVNGVTTEAVAASGTITNSTQVSFVNSYREYFDIDEEIVPEETDRENWVKSESVNDYNAIEIEMSTYLPVVTPEDMADGDFTMVFHNQLDSAFMLDDEEDVDLHITIGGEKIDPKYYTVNILSEDTWTIQPMAVADVIDKNDGCTFHVTVNLSALYNDKVISDDDLTGETEIIVYFYADLEDSGLNGSFKSTVWYDIYDDEMLLYTSEADVVEVYTFEIIITKVDSVTEGHLPGATFGIYYDSECTDPVMRNGEPYTAVSDENGQVIFYGLAEGTYYVREIEAPEGYQLEDDTVIVIELGMETTTNYIYTDAFANVPVAAETDADAKYDSGEDASETEDADLDENEDADAEDEDTSDEDEDDSNNAAAAVSGGSGSDGTTTTGTSPKTGDESASNFAIIMMVICASVAAILMLTASKKRGSATQHGKREQ